MLPDYLSKLLFLILTTHSTTTNSFVAPLFCLESGSLILFVILLLSRNCLVVQEYTSNGLFPITQIMWFCLMHQEVQKLWRCQAIPDDLAHYLQEFFSLFHTHKNTYYTNPNYIHIIVRTTICYYEPMYWPHLNTLKYIHTQ